MLDCHRTLTEFGIIHLDAYSLRSFVVRRYNCAQCTIELTCLLEFVQINSCASRKHFRAVVLFTCRFHSRELEELDTCVGSNQREGETFFMQELNQMRQTIGCPVNEIFSVASQFSAAKIASLLFRLTRPDTKCAATSTLKVGSAQWRFCF